MEVYQLAVAHGDPAEAYLDVDNWVRAWTYYFNEDPYVSNMVSMTVGDFTRNGTDDLALAWGYYFGPGQNSGSHAVVLYGDRTDMFHEHSDIELKYDTAPLVRASFSQGDITGDNVPELILGGQLHTDITAGNKDTRFVGIYTYDGNNDRFVRTTERNFDLFEQEDGEYVHKAMDPDETNRDSDIFTALQPPRPT